VIGGIYVSQEQAANDRTPGLSKIPLLRWLFQRNTITDQSTELLIFITPRIIKS
jgi:type IV pilus assembly protein PilQ